MTLPSTGAPGSVARPVTAAGIVGLHHVALVTRDVPRAADFYGRILGLRDLGDGTVPLAAPEATRVLDVRAHYFGDGPGRPGSLVALVEQRGAEPGAPGIGGTHHFALAVADRERLLMWKRRFLDEGYAVNGILDRHYFQSIYVQDPDGTIVELATLGPGWTRDEDPARIGEEHRAPPAEMVNTNRDRARIAAENWHDPIRDIDPAMHVQGMHHVTAIGAGIGRTETFLSMHLGMRRVKQTNNFDDVGSFHWYWGVGTGHPGTLVTYFERVPERERRVVMGAGQVAHYAVAAEPHTMDATASRLRDAGLHVTDAGEFGTSHVRYHAIATSDPDGQPVMIASANGPTSYDALAGHASVAQAHAQTHTQAQGSE